MDWTFYYPFISGFALNVSQCLKRLGIESSVNPEEETNEWTSLITSLLLEGISAIFDELGFALMGMVVAFLALLLSVVALIREARKEGITTDGGSLPPCFYRHSGHNFRSRKPFGSLVENFGLAGAVWQCSFSTIEYNYARRNKDNPIKMCLQPFIFALYVLIAKLVKSKLH
ncbi:hypothetical protein Peur_009345 [Populus x canadensis]